MLEGTKAIIVEDNFAVAHSLGVLLESLGCEVAGKAANVKDACKIAAGADYDVAILDISLGSEIVSDAARVAESRGKHIVYLTGFSGTELLPDDLRSHPCLAKPVRSEDLVEAIRRR